MLPLAVLSMLLLAGQSQPPKLGPWDSQVVTPDGKPAANVRVVLYGSNNSGGEMQVDAESLTDTDGRFHLEKSYAKGEYPRSLVLLANGYGISFDQPWKNPFPKRLALRPAATVKVQFLTPEGKPAVGLKVCPTFLTINSRSGNEPNYLMVPPDLQRRFEQTVDAKGWATFDHLPLGTMVRLGTEDERYAPISYQTQFAIGSIQLTVPNPIRLVPGGSIEGQVTGLDGKPAANIGIGAQSLRSEGGGNAKTDQYGHFSIRRLTASTYNVAFKFSGKEPADMTGRAVETTVETGKATTDLHLKLETGGLVAVKVFSSDGKPVADEHVGIYGPAHPQSGGWVQGGQTDSDGKALFRVPSGEQFLYLMASAPVLISKKIQVKDGETTSVELKKTPELNAQQFKGHVIGPDGKPVEGARVDYEMNVEPHWRSSRGSTETRADGSFAVAGLQDGSKVVLRAVLGADCTPSSTTAEVAKDNVIQLKKGATVALEGIVCDASGRPLQGATVRSYLWSNGMGQSGEDVTTDAIGHYRFEGLYPDQEVGFMAIASGFGGSESGHSLAAKSRTLEPFKLQLANSFISGKVLDDHDKPIAGVEVSLMSLTDQSVPPTSTDSHGLFRINGVAKGQHYVNLSKGDRQLSHSVATGKDVILVLKAIQSGPPVEDSLPPTSSLLGKAAPELQVTDWLNATPTSLKALKGRVVVIDFWAIWCSPCRQILPEVRKMSMNLKGLPVTVIGLHDSSTWPKELTAFAKKNGLTYPLAIDKSVGSRWFGKTMVSYGVYGIPTLIVIDQNGKVAAIPESVADAEKIVRKLLGK